MIPLELFPVEIKTSGIGGLTIEEFATLCQENDELDFERDAEGNIIIRAPVFSLTANFHSKINGRLEAWNEGNKFGLCFDSSAGFTLPNGAVRSPDASFISWKRWNQLSAKKQSGFAQISPDFVAEVISGSDTMRYQEKKMIEYMNNGSLLGWLIDVKKQGAWIYKPHQEPQEIKGLKEILSGGDILQGFQFDLQLLKQL